MVSSPIRITPGLMDNALATSTHATRCTVSAPIGTSPGALVYGRDMIMDVPLIANLAAIWRPEFDKAE